MFFFSEVTTAKPVARHDVTPWVVTADLAREAATSLARAAQITLAKGSVTRRQRRVECEVDEYRNPDFYYDVSALRTAQSRLNCIRPDMQGMRWLHTPTAVNFYAARDVDALYDDFVARVDIAEVTRTFRDVLSVSTEVIRRASDIARSCNCSE